MQTIVHLSETAFLSILVSGIESFPSKYQKQKKPNYVLEGEVYGLLFGQRLKKDDCIVYHATIAVPMQVVRDKSCGSITPSPRHYDRIKDIIQAYPMYEFLGDFHSHPHPKDEFKGKRSSEWSSEDAKCSTGDAFLIERNIISLIIGLTFLNKVMNGMPKKKGGCIQSYCGNYKYALSAYVTGIQEDEDEDEDEDYDEDEVNEDCDEDVNFEEAYLIEVDNLICPFATGIGNYDLGRAKKYKKK